MESNLSIYDVDRFSIEVNEALKRIPQEISELPEEHLERVAQPNETLRRLRLACSVELEKALCENRRVYNERIYLGTCGQSWFYQLLKIPEKTAYIFRPLQSMRLKLEFMYRSGIDKLWEALQDAVLYDVQQIKDADGNVTGDKLVANLDSIKKYHSILKDFENRIFGSPVQRVEKKNQNIPAEPGEEQLPKSKEELLEKAATIQKRLKFFEPPPKQVEEIEDVETGNERILSGRNDEHLAEEDD